MKLFFKISSNRCIVSKKLKVNELGYQGVFPDFNLYDQYGVLKISIKKGYRFKQFRLRYFIEINCPDDPIGRVLIEHSNFFSSHYQAQIGNSTLNIYNDYRRKASIFLDQKQVASIQYTDYYYNGWGDVFKLLFTNEIDEKIVIGILVGLFIHGDSENNYVPDFYIDLPILKRKKFNPDWLPE